MTIRFFLSYLWKLPICGLAFFAGMLLSGILLPVLGFIPPEMPAGTDASTVMLWFLVSSILLAALLAPLSRHLQANWLLRWLILFLFVWVFAAIGVVLESVIFMKTDAVSSLQNSLFTVLNFLLPAMFLSGTVAWLFHPEQPHEPGMINNHFTSNNVFLSILAALAAYPLVYFTFGLLVKPLVETYYTAGQYELSLPSWGQLIPLQFGRSLLFLLVCLPVIRFWDGSRRSLWLSLGYAIFACTSFMAVFSAYWFPWQMRLFHGLELLADGLVYAGILTVLLTPNTEGIRRTDTGRDPLQVTR